jgi:LysM repeat protein
MKRSIILSVLLLVCSIVFSQEQLIIHNNGAGLYLEHKVKPKENFYSVGRLYSISPKEIAAYNKLDMSKGLNVGQTLLIPLTESNFSQTKKTGAPVYYVVGPKEGLYRVSQRNGTVLMADLRKWNNLSKDVITPGQKLIVGYLAPAETVSGATVVNENVIVQKEKEKIKIEEKGEEKKEKEKVEEIKENDAKEKEVKTEKKVVITSPPAPVNTSSRTAVNDGEGGYFKSQYEQQVKASGTSKETTGTAGIFKTASGWQDAKYYVLIDNLDPGTIIRISNPSNNKSVYAKVLGGMSGIRQNQGYDLRISNAAASILDIADTEKFVVKLNY